MTTQPTPDPADEMAKHRAEASIEAFRAAIINADIEDVGLDPDYVPDAPGAKEGHPNVDV